MAESTEIDVYLDNNATTPLDPRVLEAMTPYLTHRFGNAASRHHRFGREAAEAVERAREQVARGIGADPREIVFTSGATESNNLALRGVADSPVYARKTRHVVTVRTEHKAVLDPCDRLASRGFTVTRLGVDGSGRLDHDALEAAVTADTLLVSVMHANNEIGILHDVAAVGRLCRERGVLFHTDATQSFGKERIDVEAFGIDLLSLSAHKLYGPKGVGALYVRRKGPRVRCEALIDGGGHERGLRSGTLNVPGIVGLGRAAELAAIENPPGETKATTEQDRIRALRDRLEDGLMTGLEGVTGNGAADPRLANTSNLSFAGTEAESLMRRMPHIAVSTSSACTSATRQPSYVLRALGAGEARIQGSIRFSLGRFTTPDEIEAAITSVIAAVTDERREGPRPDPACAVDA